MLGRASLILNCFKDDRPALTLNELTKRCGLPRSTVHRFAEQLVGIAWLERTPAGYRVGTSLFEVGSQADKFTRLRAAAEPWMLKLHETSRMCVHLAVLDGADVLYIDKISARHIHLPSRVGGRMPAYCTALGRALLGHADDDEVELVLSNDLRALTPFTATSTDAVRARIDEVRATGVAIEQEEAVRGFACVAAPIRGAGRAVAALSVTGLRDGFDVKQIAANVRAAANGVWADRFVTRAAPVAARTA
ncbi:MAG TPA: IclR family transcriptional regulator [Ilumatobacter sp.]|nr:IclR family transcriptional regulator [Ilumatobacter sp.]